MAESYLLDTVAASALLRRNPALLAVVTRNDELILPVIVVAELRFGALRADQPDAQSSRVEILIGTSTVLGCDITTASHFAQIRSELTAAGSMIPVNDIWIAGIARQHEL